MQHDSIYTVTGSEGVGKSLFFQAAIQAGFRCMVVDGRAHKPSFVIPPADDLECLVLDHVMAFPDAKELVSQAITWAYLARRDLVLVDQVQAEIEGLLPVGHLQPLNLHLYIERNAPMATWKRNGSQQTVPQRALFQELMDHVKPGTGAPYDSPFGIVTSELKPVCG